MSDEEKKKPAEEEAVDAGGGPDSAKLRALLKKSLASAEADEPIPDDAPESGAMKALLKRSLAVPDEPAEAEAAKPGEPTEADRELLLKVQKKLRQRSKGKFYGDGWSTTQSKLNYVLIAGVMLVTIIAVYLALGPSGISVR